MSSQRKGNAALLPEKKRYFDPRTGFMMVKVLPGEHYVTADPVEAIVTVLGSCVAACIRDPETGIGGMNHFMLPGDINTSSAGSAMRYGHFAMEVLINEILKTGCPRNRLEIKVFGGASVMGAANQVGHKNAEFVLDYLKNEGLSIAAQDLVGTHARRIQYSPISGKVERLILRRKQDDVVFKDETKFAGKIKDTASKAGTVELFD
ncbi:hypothetical protein QGN29_11140 [Temperatibacter marinus]|uniref:Probable chemoreceptor glutamine deamidase CheD n=1 Tax=Temperatibacter marinus TaxID=1456591 RepID=A0AA52EFE6_9PROT|nr:hypothetical protein [Temperatibacter marinus]WND02103.1 hypothetical protein QGN29_11140 [Temperatibacter marinus]